MRPAALGSSGNIQRAGCTTENTSRPPGTSTRATSLSATSMSTMNGKAPNAEHAMSTEPDAIGSEVAVAQRDRHRDPGRVVDPQAVLELAEREVDADGTRLLG